jgi:hypothetical protein
LSALPHPIGIFSEVNILVSWFHFSFSTSKHSLSSFFTLPSNPHSHFNFSILFEEREILSPSTMVFDYEKNKKKMV